jgi:DNA-binding NarL/FixJ family response regulator
MGKIRIVLIEDHELTRVGLRTALLQKGGMEVVGEADNGTDGLQIIQTLQPDIAIVDIGLPDTDGIELTKQLKARTESENLGTKIVILTLKDNKESVLAAFAAGADSYCMKDINFDNLLAAVRVTSHGYSWIDPAIARIVLQQAQVYPSQLASLPPASPVAIADSGSSLTPQPPESTLLTERELEVLQLIVEGCSNAAIAEKLYITIGTVKTHVRSILNKLSADDRTQAAVRALRSGLVG